MRIQIAQHKMRANLSDYNISRIIPNEDCCFHAFAEEMIDPNNDALVGFINTHLDTVLTLVLLIAWAECIS